LGAPELSFSAGICDLAGACPLVAVPDASGIVAAGPVLVPSCWGWGAPELSYCFGVCCCADATPALTSNAMLANTTKCFLMMRSSFPGAAETVGRETTARGDAGSCGQKTSRDHRRLTPALARCRLLLRGRHTWRRGPQANASSGVAEEIRRAKKPRFGRHHMFASICNHYNRKRIE
jgi:hypothetical protein